MDYENFKEQFVADVKDRLAEQGADVKVSVNEVNKLNESYEAITVTPEGSNIGVNMSLELFYLASFRLFFGGEDYRKKNCKRYTIFHS